jgi:uncharacterized protein YjbI with pentapeptide repeats
MKVIKPQKLALLSRTFEVGRDFMLSVAVILFFPLEDSKRLLTEVELWKFLPSELGKDAALDASMPKSRAEFLVTGAAYPPAGKPAIACAPRVRVGKLEKSLRVVGNRFWKSDVPSAPEPFTDMPVGWQNAFGGPDFKLNPLGKGAAKVKTDKGEMQFLPNVEDPKFLVKSPRDKPPPAGFGPYDFTWPQRFKKVGTYDAKWLKERFPGFAADIDWTIFNTAPDDQQMEGVFAGDETFAVEFMHPTKSRIEGNLPGATARCFINCKGEGGEQFREIPTKLDTVWLFPHAERGVLVFHGSAKVAEDDASDVLQIIAAWEETGQPRPPEHYGRVLAERLDPKKKAAAGLRDQDLLPDWPIASAPIEPGDMKAMLGDDLIKKNLRKRAARELEQRRAALTAAGIDPTAIGIPDSLPEEPKLSIEELYEASEKGRVEAEAKKVEAEQKRRALKEELKRQLAAEGLDPESAIEGLLGSAGGPPAFSAQGELQKLRAFAASVAAQGGDASDIQAMVSNPDTEKRMAEAEAHLQQAYRMTAHESAPARALDPERSARVREAVQAAVRAGESFDGRDLTGVDLSGIQLPGARLAGAFMAGARLVGANLSGADLSGVVLAHADLSGANLQGARLVRANLGAAVLTGATLNQADLGEAVLSKANLTRADLRGVSLGKAQLLETIFGGADLSEAKAPQVMFFKADLSGMRFVGAELKKATFLEAIVDGADFSGALLESAMFLGARGAGALFRNAKARNLRFVKECSFGEADFAGAELESANLRGTFLVKANFSGARLGGADLSECDLRGAKLDRVVAREIRLAKADLGGALVVGADLMGATLQKATMLGADFRGANLYQADLARVAVDSGVKFAQANLKKVRVDPKRVR